MKRISVFVSLLLVFCFPFIVRAALIDNGDGTITDTDSNLMWMKNANYVKTSGYDSDGLMNWNAAMSWAESLVYAGYDDWRLPSSLNSDGSGPCSGYNCSDSEIGHIYYAELGNVAGNNNVYKDVETGPFVNITSNSSGCDYWGCWDITDFRDFWTSTELATDTSNAWIFSAGYQTSVNDKGEDWIGAWAVRTVPVVPEPISYVLFITGGTLLAMLRMQKSRRPEALKQKKIA